MKPGDHPAFFRLPAPDGHSRESTLRLDQGGRWWHDGTPVTHRGLARALSSWIARHPDDGRFILSNGYDWCYVAIEGAPFIVESIALQQPILLRLSDASEEPLDPASLALDRDGGAWCAVKGGRFAARFSRHALLALEPLLCESSPLAIEIGGRRYPLGSRPLDDPDQAVGR